MTANFSIRGVVEGFYGEPWTHEQRVRAVDKFVEFGFNTYLIAPKDDLFQRARWREVLPRQRAAELKELITVGAARGLSVAMSVSPGLSVSYSSLPDREAVLERFVQQLGMGTHTFVLLWDDIDWDLLEPEDIARYPYIEDAQADFSNWVFDKLCQVDPSAHMMVCPMIYNGRGPNAYIQRLGSLLNPAIELMWTGREVRSNYIDSIDAATFAQDAGRPPLYWDNFPVNNLSMRFELHMGPVEGRATDLDQHARGLLANPMNQFECSLLPLATVAKYLNAPGDYEPESAWDSSFKELFGDCDDALALRTFFRCVMSSPLSTNAAPDLRRVLGEVTNLRRNGKDSDAALLLVQHAQQIEAASAAISAPDFAFAAIKMEISPWLSKFSLGAIALRAMAEQLTAPSEQTVAELKTIVRQLDADRFLVFGDILDGAIAELLSQIDEDSSAN